MSSLRRQYPFNLIERKWQDFWEREQTFRAWSPGEIIPEGHPFAQRHQVLPEKFYVLDMFPYPSGAGLHVGHPEGYTATDILARYRRARGRNVLHPMGWDAFGLPAEQYAIRTGQHPRQTTEQNIATFTRQIKALGFSYDWSREIDTTDPGYYKWTQWIFLQIYNSWFNPATRKAEPISTLPFPPDCLTGEQRQDFRDRHRLAYVAEAPVNWCPELGTVLANEEVVNGRSELGGFPVIRKPMRQWMLRITSYAERLIDDLALVDWSHSLKEMQRNWIGRSEGAEVIFQAPPSDIPGASTPLRVFTTRPDTLFGATYMVLAPEHPLVRAWTSIECAAAVGEYLDYAAGKSELERTDLAREKTGVFIGAYAINPVNQERLPIWIADYVLATYGTGAIMAVPGHDERDLEFARKFNLPVRPVVQPPDDPDPIGFVGEGTSINSGFLNGLATPAAKEKIIDWLEANSHGRRTVQYKLRDWLFSRQRYWGEPFPIVWKNGRHYPVPEEELPVLPPDLSDFKPTGTGEPPLSRATAWVQRPDGSVRETNTMPQWAGSCWYYLRYLDPHNAGRMCDPALEQYWMGSPGEAAPAGRPPAPPPQPAAENHGGVDLYVGGIEHAVLHLLYARFWHKILFDLGHVSSPEPFRRLVNQGLILGEDGQKMSKTRGNVVNPDDILAEYGADAFRLFEMFLGPLEMVKPWNSKGVEGVYRFLGRVWRLFVDEAGERQFQEALTCSPGDAAQHLEQIPLTPAVQDIEATSEQLKALHLCIRKVTDDLEHLRFNTAIAALMIFVNEAIGWAIRPTRVMSQFLQLLQPFAPHLAEELFGKLSRTKPGSNPSLSYLPWPQADPRFLAETTLEIPVQVNGKLRDKLVVPAAISNTELEQLALASPKVQAMVQGRPIRKIIVVPKKLLNIVVE